MICLKKSIVILFLFVLVAGGSVSAQWSQTSNGLEGGNVLSLLVDGNHLFAGTRAGLYHSINNGITWSTNSDNIFSPREIRCLAGTPDNLFAGTSLGAVVYRSTDAGAHWTITSTGAAPGGIKSLLVNGTKVFAGSSSGVFFSDNNGSSWTAASNGLPANSDIRSIVRIQSSIFVGAPDGVYESSNDGTSWAKVNSSISFISSLMAKGNSLFVGTLYNGELYQSVNNGSSWSPWISVNNGLPTNSNVTALSFNGSSLFAGTNAGIYQSVDDGANWVLAVAGLPAQTSVWTFSVSGSAIFSGTISGIYYSEDNGNTWSMRNTGLTNPEVSSFVSVGGNLFAGTDNGIFLSSDNGANWISASEGIIGYGLYIRTMTTDGTTIYAGTQNGIYASTNSGTSWQGVNSGIPTNALINSLVVHDGNVFVGISQGGGYHNDAIYTSTNNGASWTAANGDLPPSGNGTTKLAAGSGAIFAAVDGTIYRSTNKGVNWVSIRPGSFSTNISVLFHDGTDLYAAISYLGLYKSSNNGNTWSLVDTGAISPYITSLAKNGNLFLGAMPLATSLQNKVVSLSTNGGATWTPGGAGLTSTANYALHVHGDKLFGGFRGDKSIWSRPLSEFTAKQPQTISIDAIGAKKYGDAPFDLTAVATSNLAVTFISSNTNVATVSNNMITIHAAGSTTLIASQSGNSDYEAAPDVEVILAVGKAPQTINVTTFDKKKYGDAPFNVTATATSNLAVTFTSSNTNVAIVNHNTITIHAAGSTTLTASQSGNSDYEAAPDVEVILAVGKASQTISIDAIGAKKYGDAPFNVTATATSNFPVTINSSNTSVATVSNNTITIHAAGTTNLTASQSGNNEYDAAPEVKVIFVVDKASQTITFNTIPSKVLGSSPFIATAVSTSDLPVIFTSSDILSIAGTTVTLLKAGRASIKANQQGNSNYAAAAQVEQSFCINPPKPTISITGGATAVLTSSNETGNQWYLEGILIDGTASQTFSVSAPGNYSVKSIVDDCASLISDVASIVITGSEPDPGEIVMNVHPNAFERSVFVEVKGPAEDSVTITVTDMLGRSYYNMKGRTNYSNEVTMDNAAPGYYFVHATTSSGIYSKRVLKK